MSGPLRNGPLRNGSPRDGPLRDGTLRDGALRSGARHAAHAAAALVGVLAASFGPDTAHAAPMGFNGSWMAMADLGPNWQEAWSNYAFTPRDALGPGAVSMRSDDGATTVRLVELNYTRLVARWNLPEAQANVWFFGGVGALTGNRFGGTRTALTPGLQVDYETTRVYLAASARLYRAEGVRHDFASLRAGLSFYEVDYDETQPWAVLEVRRMRGLSDRLEVTPMLRLVHSRYFLEFGVNQARQARANLMYVF